MENLFNNLSPNKRRERFQLIRFADTWSEFPLGERVFAKDEEKPDLIVRTNKGILGIEHTELQYKPEGAKQIILREAESLQERVVDKAKQIYDAQNVPNLYLGVKFNKSKPLTKRTVDRVAESLAKVILNLAQYPTPADASVLIEAHSYERQFGTPFPVEIRHIIYTSVSNPDHVVWFAEHTHMVPEITIEIIQNAIDGKARKLHLYKQNCDSVWLLLASSGLYPSSDFKVSETVRTHRFRAPFARVFYCNCFKGETIELHLNTAPTTP
ncbi:MAG TPA: hypothetical protein VJ843_00305 [Candidatus Saccharimonadales bacterium]|nr:hypothetical protein [Candidatus Saccharimonadales bacterium]